jgi:hypothetical protein
MGRWAACMASQWVTLFKAIDGKIPYTQYAPLFLLPTEKGAPMPTRLFALNGVPDDEAEDVRALLTAAGINYYETPAGNWGISSPALARSMIAAYQRERVIRVREEYAQLRREGRHRTLIDVIRENPLRFFVYLAIIVAIVYFSIKPFMDIGK